jgi:acetolactate synthase-1/3 small subunit
MTRAPRSRPAAKSGVREDPASAYDMSHAEEGVEQRTLACIVDNEPGVLARVVGLFSARGYNIESLTVADIDKNAHQ